MEEVRRKMRGKGGEKEEKGEEESRGSDGYSRIITRSNLQRDGVLVSPFL